MKKLLASKHEKDGCSSSRRKFMKAAVVTAAGIGLGRCAAPARKSAATASEKPVPDAMVAKGYLLVDAKKCQGCVSCMMACSLAHEGKVNLSLSRIQVLQNPFSGFPEDIDMAPCRQCARPACMAACPENAIYIDTARKNIRKIDPAACTGCRACIDACPFEPARAIWNFETGRAQKCDLCENTPYWKEPGGLYGKPACLSVCPMGAIAFTEKIPIQEGDGGYQVNLRGDVWAAMGYPTD